MNTQIQSSSLVTRGAALGYGIICYLVFLITISYACGFIGNFLVPRSIDSPPILAIKNALLVDVVLLGLFALQHSGMARQGFKNWWTQVIPKVVERSTYVLMSSLCLIALFYFWQPLGGTVWQVENSIIIVMLYTLFTIGWLMVLGATFLINHFDLFGLRQVWLYFRRCDYAPLSFKTPGLYQYMRHPLYTGLLLGFWATPTMTMTHLLFAGMTTAYILTGIQLEERDLIKTFGDTYRTYCRRVPMLIPFFRRSA